MTHLALTRIRCDSDGFEGQSVFSQVTGAAQRGLTPLARNTEWEVAQLYAAGRIAEVKFVNRAGEVILNSFTK